MSEADSNLARSLDELVRVMRASWLWPSPEVGFARHVFQSARETVPVPDDGGSWPTTEPLHRAPILASTGYLIGGSRVLSDEQLDGWAMGWDRLSGREPFRPDRQSFAYRPLETLGIAIGVTRHPRLSTSASEWMRGIMERLRQDGSTEPWADLLYGAAAQFLGVRWRAHLLYRLDGTDTGVLGLLKWLVATRPSATFESITDESRIDAELLRRAVVEHPRTDDLPRAAVVHVAIRRAIRTINGSGSPLGGQKNFRIPPDVLKSIQPGTTVNFVFNYGEQHMGDKFHLKNNNIAGSAIGAGAIAVVGNITAYQTLVDQSTKLDNDVKSKLKQARDAIEQAGLNAADKKDVLDDLGKLTDEMGQNAPEAGRVQRLWKRIKEIAPAASTILAAAVSIGKLIGMAHGHTPH